MNIWKDKAERWLGLVRGGLARLRAVSIRARLSIRHHPHQWLAGFTVGLLVLTVFSLTGSTGLAVPGRSSHMRTAQVFSEAQFERVSHELSPYALSMVNRLGAGHQGWTPTGMQGWEIYDLSSNPVLVRRELSYDEARSLNELIRVADFPIPPMKSFAVRTDINDFAHALDCLTQAVYYESAFESTDGQRAVAQVVLNRVQHPAYPNTVCGVVYQGSQRVTGCQFSFTCDGSLNHQPAPAAWERSRLVAEAALKGYVYEPIGAATHYHADYVLPYWAVTLVKLKQIGAHIFYRMTGPNGAPAAFTALYAGHEDAIDARVLTGGDSRTPDAPTVVIATTPVEAAPAPKLITLTTGGEARTYLVGSPVALNSAGLAPATLPPAAAMDLGAQGRGAAPVGTLTPSRRMPTAEEIRQVNERIRAAQMQQQAPATAPGIEP